MYIRIDKDNKFINFDIPLMMNKATYEVAICIVNMIRRIRDVEVFLKTR